MRKLFIVFLLLYSSSAYSREIVFNLDHLSVQGKASEALQSGFQVRAKTSFENIDKQMLQILEWVGLEGYENLKLYPYLNYIGFQSKLSGRSANYFCIGAELEKTISISEGEIKFSADYGFGALNLKYLSGSERQFESSVGLSAGYWNSIGESHSFGVITRTGVITDKKYPIYHLSIGVGYAAQF